jgi:acyl dehydratase
MKVIDGIAGARALVGQELGASDWLTIDQALIDSFAEVTGDRQWIHVDRERAAHSPFGGTIAHGFLVLSLLPRLAAQIYRFENFSARLNYGLERVRFPSPVRSGARLRLRAVLKDLLEDERGARATMAATFELEDQAKPACVAEMVILLLP